MAELNESEKKKYMDIHMRINRDLPIEFLCEQFKKVVEDTELMWEKVIKKKKKGRL